MGQRGWGSKVGTVEINGQGFQKNRGGFGKLRPGMRIQKWKGTERLGFDSDEWWQIEGF